MSETTLSPTPSPGSPDPADDLVAMRNRIRFYRARAEQLQYALDHRLPIEQAKGILAERYQIDIDAAFELLRSFCRNNNMKIHDVARTLIEQPSEGDRRISC
ncbi:two-component system response regulator [Amycolatopsis sp. MJM2582]|uniref:ANTAR domain-containing protein n=1 Tax=Amycolatopsis TaxID=1813 RepID=UPI0005076E50|nr:MULTISPECIES: ANTAR domain-containing protein [unclassified Amycolatopsis]KFZ81861.1 two-component system response regulator [Amycolatopsis sp. MJM2582]OKK01896.1 two-component system response regulator [Amycolatopsis sp. CB00013]RSN42278.1 ANTAR domain-containing protein [Amycolatopsis sp. WAC 04197]